MMGVVQTQQEKWPVGQKDWAMGLVGDIRVSSLAARGARRVCDSRECCFLRPEEENFIPGAGNKLKGD